MYITRFTVEGSGPFPLDMLRYDQCYPATQQAVDQILVSMDETRIIGERRQIELFVAHPIRQHHKLTPERWESFGWTIVDSLEPVPVTR